MTLSALGIFSAAGAGGVAFTSDYELVATTILGSAQSSVVLDLSGLSSTYKHIQIRGVARSTAAGRDWFYVRMNATALTNGHELRSEGSSVISGGILIGSDVGFALMPGANAGTGQFGAFVMDLLDPFSTTKNKTIRTFVGNPTTSEIQVQLTSGFRNSTSATTSVTLIPRDGPNIAAGSRFSVYAVKG
jgi:hypothetical protein